MKLFVSAFISSAWATGCLDFIVNNDIELSHTRDLKKIRAPRGQAQCEEECRKTKDCHAYTLQKRGSKWCTLMAEGAGAHVNTDYISGIMSETIDYDNHYDINTCVSVQRARQCSSQPNCENYCPFGFAHDEYGCINKSCECAKLGEQILHGDLKFDPTTSWLIDDQSHDEDYSYSSSEYEDDLADVNVKVPRWDNMRDGDLYQIPYITDNIRGSAHEGIRKGMKILEDNTCIKFVPRKEEEFYINFIEKGGCWSYVGRLTYRSYIKNGQELSLGRGCDSPGIVVHEIMHALGFLHEQSRPDRDDYVTILEENIIEDQKHNFRKMDPKKWDSFGSEFDYDSIMQYYGTAFSKNRKPTIIDNRTGKPTRYMREISPSDIYQINKLYPCNKGSGVDVEEEIEEEEPIVKIVCKDQHESCKAWSLKGDCETNAEFMNDHCARSCCKCPEDTDCEVPVTTTVPPTTTTTKSDCQDISRWCQVEALTRPWKCKNNQKFQEQCPYACGLCGSGGSPADCEDRNPHCGYWTKDSSNLHYCENNPWRGWMIWHCTKSCLECDTWKDHLPEDPSKIPWLQ